MHVCKSNDARLILSLKKCEKRTWLIIIKMFTSAKLRYDICVVDLDGTTGIMCFWQVPTRNGVLWNTTKWMGTRWLLSSRLEGVWGSPICLTNNFLFKIQCWLRICFPVIQFLATRLQQIFVQDMAAHLVWYVKIFIGITSLVLGWEQTQIFWQTWIVTKKIIKGMSLWTPWDDSSLNIVDVNGSIWWSGIICCWVIN